MDPLPQISLSFLGLEGLLNPPGRDKALSDLVEGRPDVIVLGNVNRDLAFRNRLRTSLSRRGYLVTSLGSGKGTMVFARAVSDDLPGISLENVVNVSFAPPAVGEYGTASVRTMKRDDPCEWNLVIFDLPLGAEHRHPRTQSIRHLIQHPISNVAKPSVMVGNFGYADWEEPMGDPRDGGWRDVWTLKGSREEDVSSEAGRPHRIWVRMMAIESFTSVVSVPADGTPLPDLEVMRKTLRVVGRPD